MFAISDTLLVDVTYTDMALRALKTVPKSDAKRIREAIRQVADSHPQRQPFVTEMVGGEGQWRLRKGDWRAIYLMKGREIIVLDVGKRGEIYR